jgi:cytochrome c oxidase subunit I
MEATTTVETQSKLDIIKSWIFTGDHKKIGIMYIIYSLLMGIVGGFLAGVIRTQLLTPEGGVVSQEFYNSATTIHATIMIFFVVIPAISGFGNYLVPILIGARDMAFPRINAFALWLAVPAAVIMLSSFFVEGGANGTGWTSYPPLSGSKFSGGPGVDMWIFGLHLIGLSSVLGAANFIVTIFNMRCKGMTLMKMPLFVWTWLVTASMILIATPVLSGALTMLLTDRIFGTGFLIPEKGGDPILYQHLFWFYSHPAVYIMVLPGFGAASHILAAFSRKKIFGKEGMVYAICAIGVIGYLVWAHHMFTSGMPAWLQVLFSALSMLIAVPTGVKIFSWIATIWGGTIRFTVAMKMSLGFVAMFVIGGFGGIILANVPLDIQLHDSYFVVGHFHMVLSSASLLMLLASSYFWFPKMFGKKLSESIGNVVFWLFFIGAWMTFLTQHILGLQGMARRISNYAARPEFQDLNVIASIGYFMMALATLLFLYDFIRMAFSKQEPLSNDPWEINDIQETLEWETSSPVPEYNFEKIPEVK